MFTVPWSESKHWHWNRRTRTAKVFAECRVYNLPVIFEKRSYVVHHSREKTRHPLLLVASKHHVQDWGKKLGQYVKGLGTIAASIAWISTTGHRWRRCRRLSFRSFRFHVTWMVWRDFWLWDDSQRPSKPGGVFQWWSRHRVARFNKTLRYVLIEKQKRKASNKIRK